MTANRVGSTEEVVHNILVDDRHLGRSFLVSRCKVAAQFEGNAQALEEFWTHPICDGRHPFSNLGPRVRNMDWDAALPLAQWPTALRKSCHAHPRYSLHSLNQLAAEMPDAIGRVPLMHVFHREQKDVLRFKSATHSFQVLKSPDEQASDYEQHQRERDL